MIRFRWLALIGAVGCLACGPTGPQEEPAEEMVGALMDTVLTPFGQIPVAVAMDRDRWLVVAPDWDAAVVANFATGSHQPLGKGPGVDYQRPIDVFAAGDSIYLADWGMRRLTAWSRDGQLLGEVPLPEAAGGLFPKARDGVGWFYFEQPLYGGTDGVGLRDSIPILRARVGSTVADTVLRLAPPDVLEVTRENRTRVERAVFGGQDRWGVLPSGDLWVARIVRNRVIWLRKDGARTTGRGLPDPVWEVTDYDRESFMAQFPPDLRSTASGLPFALIKPPFERAFTGPDQNIWLEKSKQGLDSLRRIHVVDSVGNLTRVLAVPTRGSIIAVGDSVLLIAEQWREGVRLLRARIP
ncbi:MAG: hypothetical protein SGI84_07450 [Gemmatimonadota bacterium]|nr:hypothetical protein [Gemmatimonadota bacterium]